MPSIYDFSATTLDGRDISLGDYKGKVLLIVNTASKCGFTPQYDGLEKLHRQYGERGLAVLGFPCNQFGAQEPGDAAEIANFCSLTYDVSFPMFAKVDVNGSDAHPLYQYLKLAEGRACSAPKASSGTSPSFWSTATAKSSSAMHRRRNRRNWRRRSKACSN